MYVIYTYTGDTAIISVDSAKNENGKLVNNVLGNPNDVENNFNEVEQENQVLEHPGGVEMENNVNSNQIVVPARIEMKFTGWPIISLSTIFMTLFIQVLFIYTRSFGFDNN